MRTMRFNVDADMPRGLRRLMMVCRGKSGVERCMAQRRRRSIRSIDLMGTYTLQFSFSGTGNSQGTNLSLQGMFFNDSGCSLGDVAVRARSGQEDAAWCDF